MASRFERRTPGTSRGCTSWSGDAPCEVDPSRMGRQGVSQVRGVSSPILCGINSDGGAWRGSVFGDSSWQRLWDPVRMLLSIKLLSETQIRRPGALLYWQCIVSTRLTRALRRLASRRPAHLSRVLRGISIRPCHVFPRSRPFPEDHLPLAVHTPWTGISRALLGKPNHDPPVGATWPLATHCVHPILSLETCEGQPRVYSANKEWRKPTPSPCRMGPQFVPALARATGSIAPWGPLAASGADRRRNGPITARYFA